MAVSRITLANFRNHAETAIDGTTGFNLLVGANGAGKTNILEGLSLLAPGRGLRRAELGDMIRRGGNGGFAVGASIVGADPQWDGVRLGTSVESSQPTRRRVRINGADGSAAAMGEWLAMIWLTPSMDGLFAAPAADRRRYLDRLALAVDPRHASYVAGYDKALRERNRLLTGERPAELGWLDAIETQMAQVGTLLAESRSALVDALMAEVVRHAEHPFPRPALTYAPGGPVGADQFSQALHDGRSRDRAAGRTLVGPHRDELEVVYAAKRMPASASSTGEQKALLVAITLSHAALASKGRPAILLLDEVAAHLDPQRRAALFDRLRDSGTQVWATGTELAPFADMTGEAAVWEVSSGSAVKL